MVLGELSLPWQGETRGDAGPYSSEDWRNAWRYLFGGGVHNYAGVIPDSGQPGQYPLDVVPTSPPTRAVEVNQGSAVVYGAFYRLSVLREIAIPQNNLGNPRIDVIALRWHSTDQTIRLIRKQGTVAANPRPPALTGADGMGAILEVPLAEIRVRPGFSSIDYGDITPLAIVLPNSTAHLAVFQNNSGADIEPGRALQIDTRHDRSIEICTDIEEFIGVSLGRIKDTDWGVVQTGGIAKVYSNGSIVRGRRAIISSSGRFNDSASPSVAAAGWFVASRSGSGFVEMLLSHREVFSQRVELSTTSEWTRLVNGNPTDLVASRIYHTNLSPPADARLMIISPFGDSDDARISSIIIDLDEWRDLANADADESGIGSNDLEYMYRFLDTGFSFLTTGSHPDRNVRQVSFQERKFAVGKTFAGNIAVAIVADSSRSAGFGR